MTTVATSKTKVYRDGMAYETVAHTCQLPPLAIYEPVVNATPLWLAPGTRWNCMDPGCQLAWVVMRTGTRTAEWATLGSWPFSD